MFGSEPPSGPLAYPLGRQPPLRALFAAGHITGLRHQVAGFCARAGMVGQRLDDFVLATYELLTNAVRHGGGHGQLHLWQDDDAVICEIRDEGTGLPSSPDADNGTAHKNGTSGGRGMRLANRLTDSIRINTGPGGTTVRIRSRLRAA